MDRLRQGVARVSCSALLGGTNENTNGLVRQYLPKRTRMAHVTQRDCNRIAKTLNTRPRKRYDYDTPEERFHAA